MKMMSRKLPLGSRVTLISLASAFVVLAAAGPVSASVLGTATASVDHCYTDGYITIAGVRNVQGYGGFYVLNKTAGTGDGALIANGLVNSACIELVQDAVTGSYTYDVVMPVDAPVPLGTMGAGRAAQLQELWGRYYLTASADPQKAEAFSAAVWETIYESDAARDVTVGTGFSCSELATGMDVLANTWLASLDGSGPMADLRALVSTTSQDYVVEIPEPVTAALVLIGSLGMIIRRKRT